MSLEDVVDKLRKKILGFRDRKELIVEENTKGALIEPRLSALGVGCTGIGRSPSRV
jgi:hypothetical protein